MKRSGLIVVGAIVLVALAGWFLLRPERETIAVDLVATFQGAEKRPLGVEVFTVEDATIAGQTKRGVLPNQPSRATWHQVLIPENAVLKVSLGVLEKGWTMEGDGVLFRIGIAVGSQYDELLKLVRHPFANPPDRQWHEITLDLSEYAGERVDVVFSTNSSLAGDNRNGDFPVWGSPRITVE
jgi:hypothetical protein